jgi:DNA-binding MarR family transcriptional regulator
VDDPVALLVADVFETAGVLRRWGEETAALAGQSQARFQLLSVLSDGPMTVPAAARRLGVSRQAVQRVANDLVDEGLAVQEPNPGHRTSPLVALTEQGARTCTDISTRARTAHRETLGDLDSAQIEETRRLLRTLVDRIRPMLPRT